MNRISMFLAITIMLITAGCGTDRVAEPDRSAELARAGIDTRTAAAELVRLTGWEPTAEVEAIPIADKSFPCYLLDFEREVLVDDIVHYSFQIQVGPEPYGVIGLHRVVRARIGQGAAIGVVEIGLNAGRQ